MPFFRSALLVLLIVITVSCASREELDDTDRTQFFPRTQTEVHFDFIEHDVFPAAGSLYNTNGNFVGSCVLVTPLIAYTAAHCIQLGDLKYAQFGHEKLLIEIQLIHKDYFTTGDDIGLLIFTSASEHTPMPIVENVEIIPPMFPINTIAHGSGDKKMSKETVFRYYGILKARPNEIIFLPLKTTVWFGDSGGALVYRDEEGNCILLGIITQFSTMDGKIYECGARRADNFNIYDDIWQPWIAK